MASQSHLNLILQAAQHRVREMYETRLANQQREMDERLTEKQKEITSLKLKVERLEAQGAKVGCSHCASATKKCAFLQA